MKFELQHSDPYSSARTGLITTDHGQIKTPIFMPVGTCGSVKGVHFQETPTIYICGRDLTHFAKLEVCISSTPGTVPY